MSRFFTKSQQLQYEGKRKKKVPAALTPIHFIWRQEHITEREHRKKKKKRKKCATSRFAETALETQMHGR